MYYLAANDGTLRLYLLYLLFDVIFFVCCVIYLASNLLRECKERFPACRYNGVYDEADLPRDNYELVTDFLNENQIAVAYDCTYDLYLPRHEDFHNRIKLDFPVVAISLSDYNAIREMLGYEPIHLKEDEFTTQWREVAAEEDITAFLSSHTAVSTDAGSFTPCPGCLLYRADW